MIFISILILIMAIAIPSLKNQLSPVVLSRMTTIILLYSGVLSFNAFYIQSIGSGIGLYSGLFTANNNKFIGGGDGLNEPLRDSLELFNFILGKLKYVLEPVQVNYSNEVLSDQIYYLGIVLFILSIIIFGFIVVLLLNIILYINMDKIINYFNNKYIVWYLNINKKFLSVEIFFLGCTILYFMSTIVKGIHFIATHPIIIN